MQKIISLVIALFILSSYSFSQEKNWINKKEMNLHEMFEELFLSDGTKFIQPDSVKLSLSENISLEFKHLLLESESFKYSFDSLRRIGIRMSQDQKVKTYTWSIKLENGEHHYYGFIQKKEGKRMKVFQLKDDAKNMSDVENLTLDHKHWYGVNYYNIVDFKYRGKKCYALLGMRNNGYVSKTKVIDILYFTGKNAKFGKKAFKFNKEDDVKGLKKRQKRMLFEYNHNVSMVLNYDEKYEMIIFDHLTPENSKLKGIRRFYGPDGSYDAFHFDGSKWKYIPDKWTVNERNHKQEKLKTPRVTKELYKSNE